MPERQAAQPIPLKKGLHSGFAERPWLPLFVLAFGTASLILLLLSDQLRQRSIVEDSFSLRSCEAIRADLAISHLWLEEYVSGDHIEPGVIARHLASAIGQLDQLAGIAADRLPITGNLVTPSLHTTALRRQAASIRPLLENFRTLSEERQAGYRQSLPVGIGSPLDVEYDRVFGNLLQATRQLQEELLRHSEAHQELARRIFWTIIGLWSLVVGLAALVLRIRQRRHRRTEQALSESHAQLTHSQRMDAAGRLAGGLAHDLSNYLAAIRGHCELARMKSAPDSPMVTKMTQVLYSVDRASQLVDGLLTFGRRQAGQEKILDLRQLLQGIASMLAPSMGDRIHIETTFDDDLWPVRLDQVGIEQALVNLLVNAREAMPHGGTIELSARNLDPSSDVPRREVEITVRDQGVGILKADLEQIFEPFWTTKDASGGSGLGLATVQSFAQQNDGRVVVESSPGKGTTFRMYFARCEMPADAPPLEPLRLVSSQLGPRPDSDANRGTILDIEQTNDPDEALYGGLEGDLEGNERLLLVDDNRELRLATAEVLRALGYSVTCAGSAGQALEMAAERELDLWIVDWVLPDRDGLQLIEVLRRRHGQKTGNHPTPAILISGHPLEALTEDATASPPWDAATLFLSKRDLSPLHLARHLRALLDGSRSES